MTSLNLLALPSATGCCRPAVEQGFSLQGCLAITTPEMSADRLLLCYPGSPGLGDSTGQMIWVMLKAVPDRGQPGPSPESIALSDCSCQAASGKNPASSHLAPRLVRLQPWQGDGSPGKGASCLGHPAAQRTEPARSQQCHPMECTSPFQGQRHAQTTRCLSTFLFPW